MTWEAEEHRDIDKQITVVGPNGFTFYVDFDDVDHREIERMLHDVLTQLNWKKDWDPPSGYDPDSDYAEAEEAGEFDDDAALAP